MCLQRFLLIALLTTCACNDAELTRHSDKRNDFLQQLRAAAEAKDRAAISRLFCTEGVEGKLGEMQESTMNLLIVNPIDSMDLEPWPKDFEKEIVMNGLKHRPNVEVEGMVKVTFKKTDNSMGTGYAGSGHLSLPYGKRNNQYFIAGTIEEQTGYVGPPDRPLAVDITGRDNNFFNPVKLTGECVYMRSGMKTKVSLEETNHLSATIYGQRIISCVIRRLSGGGILQMTIKEDGRQLYDSGEVSDKDEIRFESAEQ